MSFAGLDMASFLRDNDGHSDIEFSGGEVTIEVFGFGGYRSPFRHALFRQAPFRHSPFRHAPVSLTLTLTLPVPHVDLGAGLLQYADNRPTIITFVEMVTVGMVRVGMVGVGMVPAPGFGRKRGIVYRTR